MHGARGAMPRATISYAGDQTDHIIPSSRGRNNDKSGQ
jgi:hypothetical protein